MAKSNMADRIKKIIIMIIVKVDIKDFMSSVTQVSPLLKIIILTLLILTFEF